MKLGVAGMEPGQRTLNGPQTSGRTYRNLSEPAYTIVQEIDVAVPMRDGIALLADVFRPDSDAKFPALIAASPYPRQIENSGAPMGFVEAGATDFFVPRGYVHVIANVRGTAGSGGEYSFFGPVDRTDVYDLVEWAAAQPWCDGTVGMLGISAFAIAQIQAAVENPPHLKCIFPMAVTTDIYEAAYHHGLLSKTFMLAWIRAVGVFSGLSDTFLRGKIVGLLEDVLRSPKVHAHFAHRNGEAALALMGPLVQGHHNPHPWDDLLNAVVFDHQTKDAFWQERDLTSLVSKIRVPVYLGCDWENVPMHLPGTFTALDNIAEGVPVRVAMLGSFGMTWPWESMHVEALGWFDHWLKGRDTGIMEGPPVRYILPGADDVWRESPSWPPPESNAQVFFLRADGTLSPESGPHDTDREYDHLPEALASVRTPQNAVPASLAWATAPLANDLDLAGKVRLRLNATISGGDTSWIVALQDVAPDGTVVDVTAGWQRAALRDLKTFEPAQPDIPQHYEIALVDNARRFKAGHSIRVLLRSDDTAGPEPIMGFRHAPIGIASRNVIHAGSQLSIDCMS